MGAFRLRTRPNQIAFNRDSRVFAVFSAPLRPSPDPRTPPDLSRPLRGPYESPLTQPAGTGQRWSESLWWVPVPLLGQALFALRCGLFPCLEAPRGRSPQVPRPACTPCSGVVRSITLVSFVASFRVQAIELEGGKLCQRFRLGGCPFFRLAQLWVPVP